VLILLPSLLLRAEEPATSRIRSVTQSTNKLVALKADGIGEDVEIAGAGLFWLG